MTQTRRSAFSAPGKALLAGGYLVLVPGHIACVVALSARIHAVVRGVPDESSPEGPVKIHVTSSQFRNGTWSYSVDTQGADAFVPRLTSQHGQNPFVDAAIRTVLAYIYSGPLRPASPSSIEIGIFSDDAYHSQDDAVESAVRFHNHTLPISQVPKTGLGSSAALTSALSTALLSYYDETLDVTSDAQLNRIHNLCQLAHCAAQKKIGSGFDVASAVYGSVKYTRFSPDTIPSELFAAETLSSEKGRQTLCAVVDSEWDATHVPCSLPPGLTILMGDVHTGSETPKMAAMVLKWRAENPERAAEVWSALNNANATLVNSLEHLSRLAETDAAAYTKSLSSPQTGHLLQLRHNFTEIRKYLKILTVETGAAVEPDAQTSLLDACNEIPGVIGGVVPGAGGFDAISLLVDRDQVEAIKQHTRQSSNKVFKEVTWLDLHEENTGIQREDLSLYESL